MKTFGESPFPFLALSWCLVLAAGFFAWGVILSPPRNQDKEFVGYMDGAPTTVDSDGFVVQRREDLVTGKSLVTRSALHEGVPQTYVEIQFSYMNRPTTHSCLVPTPPEIEKYLRER